MIHGGLTTFVGRITRPLLALGFAFAGLIARSEIAERYYVRIHDALNVVGDRRIVADRDVVFTWRYLPGGPHGDGHDSYVRDAQFLRVGYGKVEIEGDRFHTTLEVREDYHKPALVSWKISGPLADTGKPGTFELTSGSGRTRGEAETTPVYDVSIPNQFRGIRVWVPSGPQPIRGLLIWSNGAAHDARGIVVNEHALAFCKPHRFALVGLSHLSRQRSGRIFKVVAPGPVVTGNIHWLPTPPVAHAFIGLSETKNPQLDVMGSCAAPATATPVRLKISDVTASPWRQNRVLVNGMDVGAVSAKAPELVIPAGPPGVYVALAACTPENGPVVFSKSTS